MKETCFTELLGSRIASWQSSHFASFAILAQGLLSVVIVSVLSSAVIAVEFIEIVEESVAEQNENIQGIRIENFEQWVFNRQQTIAEAKQQLIGRLKAESDSIQSICELTDEQREKLLLAGRSDLYTFFQQYDEVRSKFAEVIKENNQHALNKLGQEIQPLQMRYNSQIYGEGSFFTKVLDHLLDEEQSARMEDLRREQREFQYRAVVMQLISELDQVAPFTHEKREQLIALIDSYTSPPKAHAGNIQRQFLTYYVLGQMANIPEDKLHPLFGKAEWKLLQQRINQGKAMKRNLEQQGLVPEAKDKT